MKGEGGKKYPFLVYEVLWLCIVVLVIFSIVSLPIYYMYVFHMPRTIRLRLDQIQINLLLGGGSLEKKPHLIKRVTACLIEESGGLLVKKYIYR